MQRFFMLHSICCAGRRNIAPKPKALLEKRTCLPRATYFYIIGICTEPHLLERAPISPPAKLGTNYIHYLIKN